MPYAEYKGEAISSSRIVLRRGVYEVEVGGLRGIANYGIAPTMGGKAWEEPVLEIHFPGAGVEDLRRETGDRAVVSLVRFIRPERRFDSAADLQRQIAADCATIPT